MRRPLLALAAARLIGYIASPYVSFWLFTRAIRANDRAALESYVDFPSVRQSLKEELRGRWPKSDRAKDDSMSGLVARLAPSLIDQLIDAFVTPDGLVALITDPAIARDAKAKDPSTLLRIQNPKTDLNWRRVRYAFFTGPATFAIDVGGTKLHFAFSGWRWRLKRIALPPSE
ncbi:MAG TPA: DUF2939 domain-containing protein [Chthoniobacterales bacterium]